MRNYDRQFSLLIIFMLLLLLPLSVLNDSTFTNLTTYKLENNNLQTELTPSDNTISLVEYSKYDDDGFGQAYAVEIKDDLAFVANGYEGLEILNISNPNKPEKISNFRTVGNATEVFIRDNQAIVIAISYLAIVDISDPYQPREIGRIDQSDLDGWIKAVDMRNNLLHIITAANGLFIFDISNPHEP
ncbi:MAG: hypothetical protein FK732_00935, partial [Asgard group archaeon]|nr:hypothetical protein [Asgard group archaeon]